MPAVSKAQRKLFGLALAVKRGEVDASTVDQKIRDLSKKKEADLKDYAETPEETLPNKLEDSVDEAAYDDPIKKNAEKRYKDHKTVSIVGIGKPFERIKVIPKGKYKIVEGDMEGRYSSPRFNVTLSKPMKPFDLAVQLAQETGWISPWNYLEMKKDHDRELGKSLTFPRAKTLFDESVDEGLSVIFEFPDEESARQFDLDIENSAIGIGDQVGNRVTVTNVDTKWRSTVKKYMKKNGGMAVKESSNKHLEEAIAYAEAMRYAIEENNAMATPGSVNGMGNVSLPGNPGTQAEFSTQETGSGDLAASSELTDDEEENEKQAKNIYNFLKFNAFVGESLNEGKVKVPKTIKSTSDLEKYFYGSDLKKAKEVWGKSFGYHLTAADDKSYFVSFDGKKRVIKLTDLKESVNEGKKYEEVEWIAPTKTFDYFGTKMTIKKGEKGLLISYESDEQYLVDFQDMRFYAMDGHQVKKTGNSITDSVNEGFEWWQPLLALAGGVGLMAGVIFAVMGPGMIVSPGAFFPGDSWGDVVRHYKKKFKDKQAAKNLKKEDVLELVNLIQTNIDKGDLDSGVKKYMKSLMNNLQKELNNDEEDLDKNKLLGLLRDVEKYAKRKGVNVNEESVNEGQYDNVDIKDLHFETDPDILDDMKLSFGYKRGGITRKEKIENADYELKRFRKKIKYWNGNKRDEDWAVDVFVPNHYNAIKSTLGNGPHAKKIKPVKWNQKKYDQWIEDMASGDGWKHSYDMAQNATMERGLVDWVKKNRTNDEDPLERIQWDIEALGE